MICWICHPGPCPTPDDCGLPALDRLERLAVLHAPLLDDAPVVDSEPPKP